MVARYGKQVLTALENLHDRQLIFVDLKPENCMLGLSGTPNAGQVYLVDFGLVARYTAFSGSHKAQVNEGMGGTPLYVSLACHQGSTPARRDDVEGLGYVLTAFLRGGHLPWEDVTSDAECLSKKKSTTLESLCQGIPGATVMIDFLKRAREIPFEAKPDYTAFQALLDRLAAAEGSTSKAGPSGRKSKTTSKTTTTPARGGSKALEDTPKKPAPRKKPAAAPAPALAPPPPASASSSSRARKVRSSGGRGSDKSGSTGKASKVQEEVEDDEEEESPRPPKRIHKARGASSASSTMKAATPDVEEVDVEITSEVSGGSSSWISFVTQPVKFLVRTLSGTTSGEEKSGKRTSRGSSGQGAPSLIEEEEEEQSDDDSVIDMTEDNGNVAYEDSDDEVEIVEAPSRTRPKRSSRGSASSKPSSSRQSQAAESSSSSYSPHSSFLAFQVIEGPHEGEKFMVSGSGAVYGGRDAGGVSLSRDRTVKPKHCSIKPSGKESRSQSLRITPLGRGGENVILVNGVKVGRSGRQLFIGDVVQIGESRMTLQKC